MIKFFSVYIVVMMLNYKDTAPCVANDLVSKFYLFCYSDTRFNPELALITGLGFSLIFSLYISTEPLWDSISLFTFMHEMLCVFICTVYNHV